MDMQKHLRRPLHHGRVDFGYLDVERGHAATNGRFVGKPLDRSEFLLTSLSVLNVDKVVARWRRSRSTV